MKRGGFFCLYAPILLSYSQFCLTPLAILTFAPLRPPEHRKYSEHVIVRARFEDTSDEQLEQNIAMSAREEYGGEDIPMIEWDMEDPQLSRCRVI